MNTPENGGFSEFESDSLVYRDLKDYITYVLDDAFDSVRQQQGRGIAEFVQVDTRSYAIPLFSVLLTESAGKPDIGVEKIRLMAVPRHSDVSIEEAAGIMEDADMLAFKTDQFFIAHQSRNGERQFYRVDDNGIYAWVPKLQDLTEENILTLSDSMTVEDFEGDQQLGDQIQTDMERNMEQLDISYAKELIAKIDLWPIVPQN